MNKATQINDLLNRRFDKSPVQVWPAIVKKVEGLTCSVDLLGTELVDVPGVNLRADEESEEGVLLVPRVGSLVYVSAVENAVDNLFVCFVSEVDRVEVVIENTKATISKAGVVVERGKLSVSVADVVEAKNDQISLTLSTNAATLKQGGATVELKGEKVSIKNGGASLKALFDDLATLLQAFQVTCAAPGSPSAPFPASVAQVVQLKTKANLLLS